MKGFLDLPYRLPYARYYKDFDRGFYVDFPRQLARMGRWFREHGCTKTLDIGAMTGGCIEYMSRLGIRMDGVQFTPDLQRLAQAALNKAGVRSRLYVSPVHAPLRVPGKARYDGIVTLGWWNLPFGRGCLRRTLGKVRELLVPGGVFMSDFFEFKDLQVPPTEALTLGDDLVLVSHAERRGSVLRKYHLWILKSRNRLLSETSDLVDRRAADVRALLEAAGLEVVRTEFLDLNYPRHFWLARKRR